MSLLLTHTGISLIICRQNGPMSDYFIDSSPITGLNCFQNATADDKADEVNRERQLKDLEHLLFDFCVFRVLFDSVRVS